MLVYDRLLLPENLNYAWNKAKRLYSTLDGYTDYAELAEFELNLEERLRAIRRRFENASWQSKRLRPLPRPKQIQDAVPIDRQYYHVSIDDQVAWIAVANALGPELDKRMPPWSYGNRLYRPAWYEQREERLSTLEIGPYRHASGHLYRKFQHSWPLFRRHVALTARAMARALPSDQDELDQADRLAALSAKSAGLRYLNTNFWNPNAEGGSNTALYHASVDLKHFYPTLRANAVLAGLSSSGDVDERMKTLLTGMLRFRLDKADMPEGTLIRVDPPYGGVQVKGLPTGLFVSGFLANVAMLQVDEIVSRRIERERKVAHFRFVDDHILLSYNFDELCEWLDFYRNVLRECGTGAEVNQEKYDPTELRDWMDIRSKSITVNKTPSLRAERRIQQVRATAVRASEIDGANPTPLLTQTLAQISALAVGNVEIMDDADLEERLKLLEWLLLANIPDREIRPDTRAAFAAGRIAVLAPILVPETVGLVETSRSLEALKNRAPDPESSTPGEISAHTALVEEKSSNLLLLEAKQRRSQEQQLRHCFGLLLQAFREYPGKPRLFYRIHEYCRVTGYGGLDDIAQWLTDARANGYSVWADYYSGLSLHILSRGVLIAARTWDAQNSLRSEHEASLRHLNDVSNIDTSAFLVPKEREAWFHAVTRREFGVALLAVAAILASSPTHFPLRMRLSRLAAQHIAVSFADAPHTWEHETGHRPGTWAHLTESILSVDESPTASWQQFQKLFCTPSVTEIRAARRYPEILPNSIWYQLLQSKTPLPSNDSGWIYEALNMNDERINTAISSRKQSFVRAAKSLRSTHTGRMTLAEWTKDLSSNFSPFDPRRSEWTALEIIRQVVAPIVHQLGIDQAYLDLLHPTNVLIPQEWSTRFPISSDQAGVNWEEWRSVADPTECGGVELKPTQVSIIDYRYYTQTLGGRHLDSWERRLTAVGRVLLGQLRLRHDSPRLWNIRGNEQVYPLPRTGWLRALAISSPTLLLISSCLSPRSAETRSIARNPELFGWKEGSRPNDANLEPPLLVGPNELLTGIVNAQRVLTNNQLAVSMNQPRQIIPFRLVDFSASPDVEEGSDGYVE